LATHAAFRCGAPVPQISQKPDGPPIMPLVGSHQASKRRSCDGWACSVTVWVYIDWR